GRRFRLKGDRMQEMTDLYLITPRREPHSITQARYKIGGMPVFLSQAAFPRCASCGDEMAFIAQIPLQSPLPLSDRYAMAYIFMCRAENPACSGETCEPFAGVNAVILQNGEDALRAEALDSAAIPEFGADWRLTQEPK